MKSIFTLAALAPFLVAFTATTHAGEGYNASAMWGTSPVPSGAQSSVAHVNNGIAAGQVNAASQGLLASTGAAGNIYAIGSQTVVSNNIIGDDNTVEIIADQTSTNEGQVNNNGQVIRNQNNN